MNKFNTGKGHPQGDTVLLNGTLELIGKIKRGLPPLEQVALFREALTCAKSWYPISNLGAKRIEEHYKDLTRDFFQENMPTSKKTGVEKACVDSYLQTRAISLSITNSQDEQLGYIKDFVERLPRMYIGVFLFLTEDCSIIALRGYSKNMGDYIAKSGAVDVLTVNDDFLIALMQHEHGFDGNKNLVINALMALCYKMSCAQDVAQKRANLVGGAHTSMTMISQAFKNAFMV